MLPKARTEDQASLILRNQNLVSGSPSLHLKNRISSSSKTHKELSKKQFFDSYLKN